MLAGLGFEQAVDRVVHPHELEVGLVDHDDHGGGDLRDEGVELGLGDGGAGRVVGRAHDDDLRAVGDRRQQPPEHRALDRGVAVDDAAGVLVHQRVRLLRRLVPPSSEVVLEGDKAGLTKLPILISGGVTLGGGDPEAELMRRVLEADLATPVKWIEATSRDTGESAQATAATDAARASNGAATPRS